jgi:hypothetical protein
MNLKRHYHENNELIYPRVVSLAFSRAPEPRNKLGFYGFFKGSCMLPQYSIAECHHAVKKSQLWFIIDIRSARTHHHIRPASRIPMHLCESPFCRVLHIYSEHILF